MDHVLKHAKPLSAEMLSSGSKFPTFVSLLTTFLASLDDSVDCETFEN